MMDYVSLPMKKVVVNSYDILIKQLPELWGFLYKKTDTPARSKHFRMLTKQINRMNSNKLYDYVKKQQPDAIICTHFLAAQVLLDAQAKDKPTIPISLVTTDYDKHDLLMLPGIHTYFVSNEKMKWKMTQAGIEKNRIVVSGIPIDPIFYEHKSVQTLKEKYGVKQDRPIILILSGGQGLAHIDTLVPHIFDLENPTTVIAIAGKNEKLKERLDALTPPPHIDFTTVGWTDHMDEYMRIADMILTKPGGMTMTECIMLQKPIIAIEPIPGQEEQNADYLLEKGLGLVVRNPDDLRYHITSLLTHYRRDPQREKKPAAEIILESITKELP
jgi:processive 1,2-diacylglycerol beta-glucosyltransferase